MTQIEMDLRLKLPFTMLVSGPTSCGKTTFVSKILENRYEIYNKSPGKVYWFYKVNQPMFQDMMEKGIVHEFIQGMCTMEWLESHVSTTPNCTVVIDDMALEVDDDTAKIFSVGSHHFNVNVILLCQNLFTKNKSFRDISLNSTYHAIFKNPRDKSSIAHFAKQFAPGKSQAVVNIFEDATQKPHSYLLMDYHQETDNANRIISNYLLEDNLPIHIHRLT